jgi:tRNA pseudouridine55 synthase
MDGVLLIDKPSGPTSHDVVARLRRTSGERGIGHTGTLDPRATGLLPLVLGRATRLASFLSGAGKTYEAGIQLGVATDTDDADGRPIGPAADSLPEREAIEAALEAFRGTFEQVPPTHSAKRIEGEKAYELARRDRPVVLKPVTVTVHQLDVIRHEPGRVIIRLVVSSGFYVRALARDLGERLGCGAHLDALRRTAAGIFDVAASIPLADAERMGPGVEQRLIPPAEALADLQAVAANEAGCRRAVHGNWLGPEHLTGSGVLGFCGSGVPRASEPVRVLDSAGGLLAIARFKAGALHPVVVLG